jgi:hypothetical protein
VVVGAVSTLLLCDMANTNYFFANPESYTKGDASGIFSKEELQHYEALGKLTDPSNIYVYSNHETASTGNHVKGYAASFSSHTPIGDFFNGGSAELLNPRWFGHAAVMHVPGKALPARMREDDMIQQIFSLSESINGLSNETERQNYADALMEDSRLYGHNVFTRDRLAFPSCLAGKSHFAGLYKKRNITLAEGGEPADFFLVVHTDSGLVGKALNKFARQSPALTLGEFINTPQYKSAQNYSRRNAMRILALMADKLYLDRDLVPREVDSLAAEPAGHLAYPEQASQVYAHSAYNYMTKLSVAGDIVAYYNTTVRLTGHGTTGSRIVQLRNARAGISVVDIDPNRDYTVLRQTVMHEATSTAPRAAIVVSSRNPLGAFPLGIGRHTDKNNGFSELTTDDARSLTHSYHWTKKGGGTTDGEFKTQAARGLYGYKRMDAVAKSTDKFLLGGNTQKLDLQAVAVILGE